MIAYVDTGFLVSLYYEDTHSVLATSLLASRPTLLLTPLIEVEFVNALELMAFRKQAPAVRIREVLESFARHYASGLFRSTPWTDEVWSRALALSRSHSKTEGTRTLDVLHVAAALVFRADTLFSFDQRQRKLAHAVNLPILPA